MKITVNYSITQSFQEKKIIEKQDASKKRKEVFPNFDVKDFSKKSLQKIISAKGSLIRENGDIDILISKQLDYDIKNEQSLIQAIIDDNLFRSQMASKEALRKAEQIEHEKNIQEKSRKFKNEMERWIHENGSSYLRKCIDLGIACRRSYRQERYIPIIKKIKERIPNPEVEIDEKYSWKSAANPPEYLLDALISIREEFPNIESELVYVDGKYSNDDWYPIDYPYEAIHISANWSNFGYLIW